MTRLLPARLCFGVQGFLAEGLTKTSAGLGSVIIDSQPLTVAILASVLFGERLNGETSSGDIPLQDGGVARMLEPQRLARCLHLPRIPPACATCTDPLVYVFITCACAAVGVFGLVLGVLGLCMLELPGDSLAETVSLIASGAWRPELPSGLGGEGGLANSGEFWMLLAAQSMAVSRLGRVRDRTDMGYIWVRAAEDRAVGLVWSILVRPWRALSLGTSCMTNHDSFAQMTRTHSRRSAR